MSDIPKMTFEEMQKMLADNGISPSGQTIKKPKAKKKAGLDPTPNAGSLTMAEPESGNVQAYMDIHFWLRDGDLFGTLLNDARTERSYRGANVVVFAHNHKRAEPCVAECKEVTLPNKSNAE